MVSTNYFVCTLGEAALLDNTGKFKTVNHLIEEQSRNCSKLPAVGFFRTGGLRDSQGFQPVIFTFQQLYDGILRTAKVLSGTLSTARGGTVALLCSSSPEFLFTWLGCIALGHPVLLIAPECSPQDVAYLCESCDVSELIVDAPNRELADESITSCSTGQHAQYRVVAEPFEGKDVFEVFKDEPCDALVFSSPNPSDIAYFHHTSGTSGTPKPVMQSHQGAVGSLPVFEGRNQATFTTTPLFHGGPADLFRAWTSNAMIWLFPSNDVPITASNVIKCLKCAQSATNESSTPPVKYFASVPYVLESMLEHEESLDLLRSMELVSVGGAALSDNAGDSIIRQGVHLVSRFGSAECGFLLSSHRDYAEDKVWQYLRLNGKVSSLGFEARDDGLSELIVLSGWPHKAKANREDGSFATSDLFEPHTSIAGAWKYHSRADSQLTLATGKKFDADQLESSILKDTDVLQDVFVFGNGRAYPGALLFRAENASQLTDEKIVEAAVPVVEEINASSQSQASVSQSMLVPLPYSENAVDKSSKGTVLRKKVEERYQAVIDEAYASEDEIDDVQKNENLVEIIQRIIKQALPRRKQELTSTSDLYAFGVDSIAGLHIRRSLQKLLPKTAKRLPVDVIEECGSIECLATYLDHIRSGREIDEDGGNEDDSAEMLRLVEKYSNFDTGQDFRNSAEATPGHLDHKEVVVITGVTGSLGAHTVDLLRSDSTVTKIYCLVRGSDDRSAFQRVYKALQERKMHPINQDDAKVRVLASKLHQDDLGLSKGTYDQISKDATTIMHLAWPVNFRMKLHSFEKDAIAGLQNLIQLALRSPHAQCPKLAFCSSTASSINSDQNPIPEIILPDPSSASETGYAKSKWVAEHIYDRANATTRLRGRVLVFRVGQLSGDTETGTWNMKEAWPMMLSTIGSVKCLPDLGDESLNWLPVNVAAQAMLEGTLTATSNESLRVFHVLNDNSSPTWMDVLQSLSKSVSFDVVSRDEWINYLENKLQDGSDHPALQLVDHWKTSFADEANQKGQAKDFSLDQTKMAIPSMRTPYRLDEAYFEKLWNWINTNMIAEQPTKYAYSTLLTRVSYLAGVIVLANTLRKHGSQYPLIVFYTSALSASAVRVLEDEAGSLNIIPRLCDPLLPPGHDRMPLIAQRFADTWTKLRVFEIFDYDALCYLDADMAIFNSNMDDIFSYLEDLPLDHIAANHVCCCNLDNDSWAPSDWTKENCAYTPLSHPSALTHPTPVRHDSRSTHQLLNGGLFLYRPTRALWDGMMHFFNTSEKLQHYMFPDQDFLADFFRNRWQSVGWQWNALKTMRYWHPDMWRDNEVRCLHYIVDKPWAARIQADGIAGYKGRDGETHRWWWNEYSEWREEALSQGKREAVTTVEEKVASVDGTQSEDPDMTAISPPPKS